MRKIANTDELTSELRRLLRYAASHQPSRVSIARELRTLSERLVVAANKFRLESPGGYKGYAPTLEKAKDQAGRISKQQHVTVNVYEDHDLVCTFGPDGKEND